MREAGMDSTRFELMQSVFHHAVELPAAERGSYVTAACDGDDELCASVEQMLAQDSCGTSLLDRGLADTAGAVVPLSLPPSVAAQSFGPYRLSCLLGEGGAGVVYLGTRDDLGSKAAVKILRDAWLSPARRERFAEEQRILAQLNHPAIARLYDADTLADGTPWFAMEFVEGVPLTEFCDRRRLSLSERLALFGRVCDAVQYAHRQMVVHRDLKPSNIAVTNDGGVKLLDFGIAKPISTQLPDPTRTGLRFMTPAYAAPEQVLGGATGVATDVYALGVILYELLAGRVPFETTNRTPAEVERLVADSDPVKPSVAAPAIVRRALGRHEWADLDTLCLTAMQKDPERRYGTVEALHRDVRHFQRSEPLDARPDSVGYRLRKFATRRRVPLTVAAAVLLIVSSMAGFYTLRLATARNEALAQVRRSDRLQEFMLGLFTGGEREQIPSQDVRVVDLLDRGMVQARSLSAEPVTQVALFRTLGDVYQSLGHLDQANQATQAAVDIATERLGLEARGTIDSRAHLALLRGNEHAAREAVAAARRSLAPDDPLRIGAVTSLGRLLANLGRYDEAITVLGEAVQVAEATAPDSSELRTALNELGSSHLYAGHLEEAEALYQRALALSRRHMGDRHPQVADLLANLGAIEQKRGRIREAERYYREALDLNTAWFGEDSTVTAKSLTQVAAALNALGRSEDAAPFVFRALAIQEKRLGPGDYRLALTLNTLGWTMLALDRTDEAETYARRGVALVKSTFGPRHLNAGITTGQVGAILLARGNARAAEAELRDGMAIITKAVGADHLNAGLIRAVLGRALLRQGRIAEAETESLAAYTIMTGKTAPTTLQLVWAREDLADIYDAQHRPTEAAKIRAEAAAVASEATAITNR
jgi:serine/threonine-protein kinase